jgi:site-specific recombinase XerD
MYCQSIAIKQLEVGYHIRAVQELLEHKEVKTTMICRLPGPADAL